jgi:hypothetical protein
MRRTYLALFGCYFAAGYGISSIVAGLLDPHLPYAIWTIQLGAGALSLLVLAALKKRSAVSGQQKLKS